MKRHDETVWTADSGVAILRLQPGDLYWLAFQQECNREELAELGKAIIDALAGTAEGQDLLVFADDQTKNQLRRDR